MIQTIYTQNHLFIVALAHLCDFPMESCSLVAEAKINQGAIAFIMKTGLEQTYKITASTIKIKAIAVAEAIS